MDALKAWTAPEEDEGVMTLSDVILRPDPSRTVIRPFVPADPEAYAVEGHPRPQRIFERVMSLSPEDLHSKLQIMREVLDARHRELEGLLLRRFDEVNGELISSCSPTREQRMLVGAYFSQEYSFEAAALFNPSMVPHPAGGTLPDGSARFLISLRGIGEGHVSSVTFRTGTWNEKDGFAIDTPSASAVPPRIDSTDPDGAVCLVCDDSQNVSETVIFPTTPSQRQGVEDLRMVHFTNEDGTTELYGTYTAFDGRDARSELMHARDFRSFLLRPIGGKFGGAKGMALFPRKVNGRYAMLSRQDNENIWLLTSDDLYTWDEGVKLVTPRYSWEFVQMGNCGSPIELDEGWLVLTHGVGMVRSYCVGACLLDKDDPSKLLARTELPLLMPSPKTRDGYVPNVVYSCGAMLHDRTLLLPYGVADNFTTFASAPVDKILAAMS